MAKESKTIICESCDSEYTLRYARNMVSGTPVHCTFCGEVMDMEDDLDDPEYSEQEPDDY